MANTVIALGSASISINPQKTEARLVFVPDPKGDGWDSAAVNKLAKENNLGSFPDPKALDTFLVKAGRSRGAMEFVLCQGAEPEDKTEEKINWEALPVPEDIAPFKEETLGKAGDPKIVRIKVEKIKHEKKVKKPGALLFLHAKEETVVNWERRETREEVTVNRELRDVKYAEKGAKLGTITPSSPGKPGKSIFGRPIPPRSTGEGDCLFGEGIAREKNELFARVSGFIRIGENWADMVPLPKHSWSINTGIDGLTLFFHFEPGGACFAPPTGEEILAAAAEKGAGTNSMISAGELDEAIALAIKNHEPLEAFSLFRSQEAEARVEINPDKTRAALFLRKGTAGALPLEMKAISQAIKDSGVHGFDAEQLKTVIRTFMEGKELELKDYVLIEGAPSTRGKDRDVELLVTPLSPEEQKTVLAQLKAWNSRELSGAMTFAFVEKDAVVARIGAGSDGEAGKDIYGNVIPGLPGNDPDIRLGRGLELHGSDISASCGGLLLLEAAEKSFRGEVIDYRDAKIEVHVSEDAMEARGDFFREEGPGVPLTVENVQKALNALGVTKGIGWEAIEKACELARRRGSVSGLVIAKGQLPLAKGGSAIKWHVPLNPPELAASVEADVSAEQTVQIKAGAVIVEFSEPVPDGRPGYDVKGKEIPIDRGTVQSIEHDDSIREVPVGKARRFIAVRSGELGYDGHSLKITSIRTIQGDVGPDSGKIKFSGEIQISGNVLPGSAIIGGSHVVVNGVVEEALISAEGKATVVLGIKGGGKGIVRARAGIETAFAERSSVMSVGDIKLKRGAILSAIKTNGKLSISAENGKLTGGVCQARMGIDAFNIGSENGVRTEMSFGQDYLVKEQIGACEEEIAKLKAVLSETENRIKDCLDKKRPLPPEIPKEKVRLVKLLEQLNLKLFTLREKFEEHFQSEIRVRGTVFPGVVIESHDRYYEVKQKRSRVLFYFDRESGSIKEKPLD